MQEETRKQQALKSTPYFHSVDWGGNPVEVSEDEFKKLEDCGRKKMAITEEPVFRELEDYETADEDEICDTPLGVTFDRRLTWKAHLTNADSKERKKLPNLQKLAGTNLLAHQNILKTVYLWTIRPILEYGSSAWITAAKTNQQRLDKVQNQALRIITGALKSTPIKAMEDATVFPPLAKRRESKTLAKNQDTYTSETWTQVYTIGSASAAIKDVGACIFILYISGRSRTNSIPTGRHCTNYRSENEAIKQAIKLIEESPEGCPNVVIFTDALSVLQAPENSKQTSISRALFSLCKTRVLSLQWIPVHCGVPGNVNADR
ncbi:uncharacterized protein LOC128548726 [Mercenaria mercenaria]|uniref:uncharacterized protein LOC128548726 n=1 Tax=Mercenaria mercenaria TaxID=6596 RepID=UPI00234ED7DA|nr:uncharacterized protein LOC128548726 [Mercenaria mercenaria]